MSVTMATPYPMTDSDTDSRGKPSPLPSPGLLCPGPAPLSPGSSPLAGLERDLALGISDLVAMGDGARRMLDSERRLADVNKNLAYMRSKMRQLRRWRSGVETGSEGHINDLAAFIQRSQFRIYETRIAQLVEHVTELDVSLENSDQKKEPEVEKLRADIDCLLPVLRERLRSVDSERESVTCLSGFREDLSEIHNTVILLCDKLSKSAEKAKRRSAPPVLRSASISSPSRRNYSRIERHPLINPLLRMLGRVRRLMTYFRHGYHEQTEGSIPCVDNDTEVLARQLEKISRWRKCMKEFTAEDLENMETVVSAMERHIRDDFDVTKPLSCDNGMDCKDAKCSARAPEIPAKPEAGEEKADDKNAEVTDTKTHDVTDSVSDSKPNGDLSKIDLNFNEEISVKARNGIITEEEEIDERLI